MLRAATEAERWRNAVTTQLAFPASAPSLWCRWRTRGGGGATSACAPWSPVRRRRRVAPRPRRAAGVAPSGQVRGRRQARRPPVLAGWLPTRGPPAARARRGAQREHRRGLQQVVAQVVHLSDGGSALAAARRAARCRAHAARAASSHPPLRSCRRRRRGPIRPRGSRGRRCAAGGFAAAAQRLAVQWHPQDLQPAPSPRRLGPRHRQV